MGQTDPKAFLLCAGLGKRLRPLTHAMPKALVPFLNLPLICYNWFLLEEMGISRILLNSHLFTESLSRFVTAIKKPHQRIRVFHEDRPLGSAGALRVLKKHFEKEEAFVYLNSDSLLFPSRRSLLKDFITLARQKNDVSSGKTSLRGFFYAVPFQKRKQETERALWTDRGNILRAIGDHREGARLKAKWGRLRPWRFSGLALFKRDIFKLLTNRSFHIFDKDLLPVFTGGEFQIFPDEEGLILDGGAMAPYIASTGKALSWLFSNRDSSVKQHLEDVFFRFDPKDQFIGLKRGRKLKSQFKMPLLCPENVKGLEFFSGKNFAVLGGEVCFFGKSFLKGTVLGPGVHWSGSLKNQLLFAPLAES